MSDDGIPGIGITVNDGTVELSFPPSDQAIVPLIPEELRDRDIPAFVIEWILESDEIATIVQELLQAPTRSLCRQYVVPFGPSSSSTNLKSGQLDPKFQFQSWQSPTPPVLRRDQFGVTGFDAGGTIVGLPVGIRLPAQLLDIIVMARKVDAWLTKGQRVLEWANDEGVPEASWMPFTDS